MEFWTLAIFKSRPKRAAGHSQRPQRSGRWPWAVLIVFAALGFAWWAYGDFIRGNAETGSAYLARVACSCRYVAGRSLDDCGKDALEGMGMISLSQNLDDKTVTATAPLIASSTARYREGQGCVLESWPE